MPVEFANLGQGVYRFKIAPYRYWRPGANRYIVSYGNGFTQPSQWGELDVPF